MTGIQYKRQIRLTIGGFGRDGDAATSGGGIIIDDQDGSLRIHFDITLTADESAPSGTVDVYNLKKTSHEIIERHGDDISIDAGYAFGAGMARIFTGRIKRVIKTRVDHAFVTRITITDALSVRSSANKNANISENDRSLYIRDIARKIVKEEMGLEVSNIHVIPVDAVYPNFSHSGDPRTALATLLANTASTDGKRLSFDVDGDKVQFTKGLDPVDDGEVVIKSPANGLIGTPEPEEDGRATFKMLLEPRLSLRGTFEIRDSDYMDDAVFTITKIQHLGDNWEGNFISTIECIDPDKVPVSSSLTSTGERQLGTRGSPNDPGVGGAS